MNLLKFWNSLGNKFGEGMIIFVALVAIFVLVYIYSFYKVRWH